MHALLREYVRRVLERTQCTRSGGGSTCFTAPGVTIDADDSGDHLLTEPDEPDKEESEETEEASVAGAVAGVTVPLGAGPTYPDMPKKKRKRKSK